MTYAIDAALTAALAGLVAGRVHPVRLPDAPLFPSIRYVIAGATPQNTITSGVMLTQYRYRLSVFALTQKEAAQICASIRALMPNFAYRNWPQGEFQMYEPDTQAYHHVLDYSIWTELSGSAARRTRQAALQR